MNVKEILSQLVHNKTIRNGSIFSLFSFLNSGVSFLIMLVMGRFIAPDSYGQLSLFTTIVQLLTIFICLGTNGIVSVDYFRENKKYIQGLVNVVMLSSLGVYTLLLLSVIFCSDLLKHYIGIDPQFQFYVISVCLLQIFINILLDVWRLEEKVINYGSFSILTTLLNLILTLLFVGCLRWDWKGRVYANVISCFVFAVAALIILIRKRYIVLALPTKHQFLESYHFGIPLLPHSMSFWLRQGLDRYVINFFITGAVVGLYSFAYNFGNIIQIIGFSFNASNSVHIYQLLSSDSWDKKMKLQRECRFLILFYTILSIVVYLAALIFIPIIFPQYADCIVYLLPLCVGSMFQCYYLVYVNVLFFYKTTKVLMYITFSSSLLHAVLSFGFTRYGAIYTSFVMVLSNFLIFVGVYVYSRRVLDLHISDEHQTRRKV